MPKCNLIEYIENYQIKSGILWEYCRNEPDNDIPDSESFKLKSRFTNSTGIAVTLNAEIVFSSKHFSIF